MRAIWEGTDRRVRPMVLQRPDGGLVFRYFAPFHTDCVCEYSLWCEVGERYKGYFSAFWVGRELDATPVKINKKPYIFDRLKVNHGHN